MWPFHLKIFRVTMAATIYMLLTIIITTTTSTTLCKGYTPVTRYRISRHHNIPTTTTITFMIRSHSRDLTRRNLSMYDELSTPSRNACYHDANKSMLKDILQFVVPPLLITSCILTLALIYQPSAAYGAPPFAVIAEELGYFPVSVPSSSSGGTKDGTKIQYVAKRVRHPSTQQAIDLANFIRTNDQQVILAGTYWCSHTSHQKELFGVEAWNELNRKEIPTPKPNQRRSNVGGFTYIECAPQGYGSNPTICSNLKIDGYPTWIITTTDRKDSKLKTSKSTIRLSGERSLCDIAQAIGYTDKFDAAVEDAANPPVGMGSAACK